MKKEIYNAVKEAFKATEILPDYGLGGSVAYIQNEVLKELREKQEEYLKKIK